MEIKKIPYEERVCECCSGDSLELLYQFEYDAHTVNYIWNFQIRNVICRNCGFVFVSPAPNPNHLLSYYEDSFSKFAVQQIDYNVKNRIAYIRQWLDAGKGGRFLEIGAHNKTAFHDELGALFDEVTTMEPNREISGHDLRAHDAALPQADFVAHYFVLEHVPNVADFLRNCYESLRPGGVMVCEVPDLHIYPRDISALILHEHVNHFTPEILSAIAAGIGFSTLGFSNEFCSRSFGFVMAFRREMQSTLLEPKAYETNKQLFRLGVASVMEFNDKRKTILNLIQSQSDEHKRVIIWGANDNLLRLFPDESDIPDQVTIVDSNPKKKSFLKTRETKLPAEVSGFIHEIEVIIILTNIHAKAILASLEENYGKTFHDRNVYLFDFYNPFNREMINK